MDRRLPGPPRQYGLQPRGPLPGQQAVPLDDIGREQAAGWPSAARASGPRTRGAARWNAREKRRRVAARIGIRPIEDARFAETDAGDWKRPQLRRGGRRGPRGFRRVPAHRPAFAFPGAASPAPNRICASVAGLERPRGPSRGPPALVVCHRGGHPPGPGRRAGGRGRAAMEAARTPRWSRCTPTAAWTAHELPGRSVCSPSLVVATFGAFFVAQRLKNSPPRSCSASVYDPAPFRPIATGARTYRA